MKAKIKKELDGQEIIELRKKLSESRLAFAKAMLDHKQFKLKNTSSLTSMRKEIAVILTVIKEKEINNGKNV